ncbi:hypothetical protein N9K75_02780, partial [bacterium]|nr:hypothetical protein [bacterium]
NLIAAIRKIDITELLNEVTDDTPQQPDIPEFVYSSIYDFNISDINDNVCLENTPITIRKKKRNKTQFNPLEDDIEREPSISTNLGGLLHTTRDIIKTDLYPSIRNPGAEASIQPADTQYINSNFVKEGETINILNPQSKVRLPSEFRQHLYENTKQFNQHTPYCIVYGTFTPNKKAMYHVSAAIVYNGNLYPFGWTNESVLDNPRDKTIRPLQAILVSPETINPRWNYFIIDIILLTGKMLSKIEKFFDNSTLKTTVDYYEMYTDGPAKGTLGIMFGENHLYVDKTKYTRVANNLTQVCFGFNCSSWIEYIFGINCRLFSLSVMPSIPNYCKRSGYKRVFKIEVLNNIIQSIRDEDFSSLFQLIYNVKIPRTNNSFGGNNIQSWTKKTKGRSNKKHNSVKILSKQRHASTKKRYTKRNSTKTQSKFVF